MKHIREFKNQETFIEWLSRKSGIQITEGDPRFGLFGAVFNLGDKRVIRLSRTQHLTYKHMLNKNIPGAVRVYSMGKIKIPNRYLDHLPTNIRCVKFGMDYKMKSNFDKLCTRNGYVYYTVMEKVDIPKDLVLNIDHISDSIKHMENDEQHETAYLGLKHIYDCIYWADEEEDYMNVVQDLYDTISNDFGPRQAKKLHILMADIVALFKKLVKNFNWDDIHSGQFGYNTKGELIAFDLDGAKFEGDGRIKTVIKECLNETNQVKSKH